jgi:hypothetical protein
VAYAHDIPVYPAVVQPETQKGPIGEYFRKGFIFSENTAIQPMLEARGAPSHGTLTADENSDVNEYLKKQ